MKHEPFQAFAQGQCYGYEVSVFPITTDTPGEYYMTVGATNEAIYITKQQAMDFFGLIEAPATDPLAELYKLIGVTNQQDAIRQINWFMN